MYLYKKEKEKKKKRKRKRKTHIIRAALDNRAKVYIYI